MAVIFMGMHSHTDITLPCATCRALDATMRTLSRSAPAPVPVCVVPRFLFVGERRSTTAIRRGWTWADGHLAARTLDAALVSIGLSRADYMCINILDDDGTLNTPGLVLIQGLHARGWLVMSLGKTTDTLLCRQGVPVDATLIHPAARGSIRRRATYHAHVAHVLTPFLQGTASSGLA